MTAPAPQFLGLPNLSDVINSVLGHLELPGKTELDDLKSEIEPFIDAVNKVTEFADKYGNYIPGAKAVVGPLDLLNKSLQLVRSLLEHV